MTGLRQVYIFTVKQLFLTFEVFKANDYCLATLGNSTVPLVVRKTFFSFKSALSAVLN